MDGTARSALAQIGVYTEGGEARPDAAAPFFSIVIPMFNREAFIGRALRSCLAQEIGDWEAVVVDDGSTDHSVQAAMAIADRRIRLIRHERNLGVCPARNSGLRAARGRWIIFLDSDDELAPGALRLMYDAAQRASNDVHRLVFSLVSDDGTLSPQPLLTGGALWEYRDYVEWLGRTRGRTDYMNCIRSDVFESHAWPENRALEALFHFELARRFRTECHSEIAGVVHSDAPNRSVNLDADRELRAAPDISDAMTKLLEEHGEALRQWAPEAFATFARSAAVNSFLAGRRGRGARHALALLRRKPWKFSSWATLAFATLGRRGVAGALALKKRFRRRNA